MNKYLKYGLVLTLFLSATTPAFSFSLKSLWNRLIGRAEDDQTINAKVLKQYQQKIDVLLANKISKPHKLNALIPQNHVRYRKELVNQKKGELVKKMFALLPYTSGKEKAECLEMFVKEWQFDMDGAEFIHWLMKLIQGNPGEVCWVRDTLEKALQLGADPNKIDADGNAPLHFLPAWYHDPLLILLDAEADPDIVDAAGQTAAHKLADACEPFSLIMYGTLAFVTNPELEDDNNKTFRKLHDECINKKYKFHKHP